MNLGIALRLGRVSNLPTVWTNALAGAVLATGGVPAFWTVVLSGLALTFFYEGGMWLNDAFDAEIDAAERADRPIPNGEISRSAVFTGGWILMGAGVLVSALLSPTCGVIGLLLSGAIVLYDWLHKRTVLSPVIMGSTRFLSYCLAAFAAATLTSAALWGALGLFAYIIGLTYAAKQEAYDKLGAAWPLAVLAAPLLYALTIGLEQPSTLIFLAALAAVVAFALRRLFRRAKGDVPVAVVTLIAGISLYDAALIAATGSFGLAVLAACGFLVTLALQRVASGT
jgi:4-hydroxybenzoate polyprenyltransferase